MKKYMVTLVVLCGCMMGCNKSERNESAQADGACVKIKETVGALTSGFYDEEPCFATFSIMVRHIVEERNFYFKIDDADPRKRPRRDIQYVLDLCSLADSECARILKVLEANEMAMEKCAAESDYRGDYLQIRRRHYEQKRSQILEMSKSVSLVRKAAFFYHSNRGRAIYDDGIVRFNDQETQRIWEDIIAAIDDERSLLVRYYDVNLMRTRDGYDAARSNACHRCMERREQVKSNARNQNGN